MLEDPESFLKDLRGKKVVFDEIHRLNNPSELLKIATDHYPDIKVILCPWYVKEAQRYSSWQKD